MTEAEKNKENHVCTYVPGGCSSVPSGASLCCQDGRGLPCCCLQDGKWFLCYHYISVLFVRWCGGVGDDKKKAWKQNRGLHFCCLQLQDGRCFLYHHCFVCEAWWVFEIRESGLESGWMTTFLMPTSTRW